MDEKMRRVKGTGSIQYIAPNKWIGVVKYGHNASGNPRVKKFTCKTEAEARRRINAFRKEIEGNNIVDASCQSVGHFMETWLVNVKKPDLKPTSYARLKGTIEAHVIPNLGHLQIGNINGMDIQQVLNNLYANGLSYSSVKKVYDALHGCFTWAVHQHMMSFNPTNGLTIPGSKKEKSNKKNKNVQPAKFYTKDEQDRLIDAALSEYGCGVQVYRYGEVVPFLLNTGLRLGELLALQWKRDVNLKARTIKITHSIVCIPDEKHPGKVILLEQDTTKSEAGQRELYLNDEAYAAMLSMKDKTGYGKYVFGTKNDKPLHPSNIERLMRTVCARAGFGPDKTYGPHSLRHSFASNLIRSGVDIKVVSELLGHSDVTITMNIYVHIIEDQKRKAVTVICARN